MRDYLWTGFVALIAYLTGAGWSWGHALGAVVFVAGCCTAMFVVDAAATLIRKRRTVRA